MYKLHAAAFSHCILLQNVGVKLLSIVENASKFMF